MVYLTGHRAPTPYSSLLSWAPMLCMEGRASRDEYYGVFGRTVMRLTFDWPLTFTAYTLREFLGLRLFSPLASVYDGTIVQGSMPFPSDVKTLVGEHGVVAVVNMCDEYKGPTAEYRKLGVEQLRLRTFDTTVPKPEDLRRGAEFIRDIKRRKPEGRVFVHCKGGIGRASCMSLAHYVINEGVGGGAPGKVGVMEKVREMRGIRNVVYEGVGGYWAIRRLVEEERKRK